MACSDPSLPSHRVVVFNDLLRELIVLSIQKWEALEHEEQLEVAQDLIPEVEQVQHHVSSQCLVTFSARHYCMQCHVALHCLWLFMPGVGFPPEAGHGHSVLSA